MEKEIIKNEDGSLTVVCCETTETRIDYSKEDLESKLRTLLKSKSKFLEDVDPKILEIQGLLTNFQ